MEVMRKKGARRDGQVEGGEKAEGHREITREDKERERRRKRTKKREGKRKRGVRGKQQELWATCY